MLTGSISQLCQNIPFCEGAKAVLQDNPKVVLLTAVGAVGITLIARRILSAPQDRYWNLDQFMLGSGSASTLPVPGPKESQTSAAPRSSTKQHASAAASSAKQGDETQQCRARWQARAVIQRKNKQKSPEELKTVSLGLIEEDAAGSERLLITDDICDTSHGNFPFDFRYFRNSFPCDIVINGVSFTSASAALFAMQFPDHLKEFQGKDFHAALALTLEKEWEHPEKWPESEEGQKGIYRILKAKFSEKSLKRKLLATADTYLIYKPMDSDSIKFAKDENQIGIMLMQIRGELGGTGVVEPPEEDEEE